MRWSVQLQQRRWSILLDLDHIQQVENLHCCHNKYYNCIHTYLGSSSSCYTARFQIRARIRLWLDQHCSKAILLRWTLLLVIGSWKEHVASTVVCKYILTLYAPGRGNDLQNLLTLRKGIWRFGVHHVSCTTRSKVTACHCIQCTYQHCRVQGTYIGAKYWSGIGQSWYSNELKYMIVVTTQSDSVNVLCSPQLRLMDSQHRLSGLLPDFPSDPPLEPIQYTRSEFQNPPS